MPSHTLALTAYTIHAVFTVENINASVWQSQLIMIHDLDFFEKVMYNKQFIYKATSLEFSCV